MDTTTVASDVPALEWTYNCDEWSTQGRLGTLYHVSVEDDGYTEVEDEDGPEEVEKVRRNGQFQCWRQIEGGFSGTLDRSNTPPIYPCLCEAKRAIEQFDAADGTPLKRDE